jgi:hypothetical protein
MRLHCNVPFVQESSTSILQNQEFVDQNYSKSEVNSTLVSVSDLTSWLHTTALIDRTLEDLLLGTAGLSKPLLQA